MYSCLQCDWEGYVIDAISGIEDAPWCACPRCGGAVSFTPEADDWPEED
jgi:predicted nucleic acid-binding Zn ribbon protein